MKKIDKEKYEKEIKSFFMQMINTLPSTPDGDDIVFDSTYDADMFFRMNKECMKILKEQKVED